jgi:hypothetical protein
MSSVLIGYPAGWTLAVLDDADGASRAATALHGLGFGPDEVMAIAGADAPSQLRRLGASSGPLARWRRAFQFMAMDQLPDLFVYEAALGEGRAIVAVRARPDRRVQAVEALRAHGAHFINSFGAWATAEIEPWHGPKPPLPQHMQR